MHWHVFGQLLFFFKHSKDKFLMKKDNFAIIIKVLSGFSLALIIVIATGIITYKTLSQLVNTVSSISAPNDKLIQLKEIVNELSAAEEAVKAYSISREQKFLLPYNRLANTLGDKMDRLRYLTVNNDFHQQRIDTIEFLVNEKIAVLEEYIFLEKENETQDPISKALKQIPATPTSEKNKKVEEVTEKGLWALFSNANKNKNIQGAAQKEEWTRIMSEIRTVISQARLKERQQEQELSAKELELATKDMAVMAHIRALIDAMEDEEVLISLQRAQQAKLVADKAILFVIGLSAAGILIALFFVSFILKDIARGNRFKAKLLQAQKNAENLARTKEEFLTNMSHEVRTPMNVIMGFTDQLLKIDADENRQVFLDGIKKSSIHLLAIINDILDYSKIESGKLEMETIGFRIKDVLNDIFVSLKESAGQKNIRFEYNIDKCTPEILLGDPVRLKQILLNLAGNAIKFTEKGKVEIHCEPFHEHENQVTLKISVKDTGIGIGKDKLVSIFKEFNQADTSTTRKYGGSGLGLTISRKLVELQNGTISVESIEGKGSVFTFVIPYAKGSETDIEEEEQVYLPDFPLLKGKRILVVDDEELNRYLAEFILEQWKVEVEVAASGKQAIEKVINNDFDVILMDIQMPEMSGVEVVKYIRNELEDKKKRSIPVIAVTANAINGEEEKYLNAGMNEYISKPFKEKTLFTKLLKVMNIKNKDIPVKYKEAGPRTSTEEKRLYNLEHLKKITKADNAFLIKMLEIFIEHTPVTFNQLQIAVNAGNWEQASSLAHKLGPSFVHLGITELAGMIKNLETDAKKRNNLEKFPESLSHLLKETNKIIDQLKKEVIQLKQNEKPV